MLGNLWRYISSIGIKESDDDDLAKRIRLTNQFCTISFIIFFFSGINNLLLSDIYSFFLIEGFAIMCLLSLYFNKSYYHRFSAIFLFNIVSIAVFYFDSYSGQLSGTYLFYFPLILAIAFLFDFKKENRIMIIQDRKSVV